MKRIEWIEEMGERVLSGIMGLAVADALGVPVEFMDRETLVREPVVGTRSYGTYNTLPAHGPMILA